MEIFCKGHEVAVALSQLIGHDSDSITHSHYHYPVEVGEFTAWDINNSRRKT